LSYVRRAQPHRVDAALWDTQGNTPSQEQRFAVCLPAVGLTYSAQWLNAFGAAHWKEFAGQNYFDERGVFISVMYSTPMLLCAFFLLLNALRSASALLIEVKKLQIKDERRKKRKQEKGD
jgi:transmembrane protein 18